MKCLDRLATPSGNLTILSLGLDRLRAIARDRVTGIQMEGSKHPLSGRAELRVAARSLWMIACTVSLLGGEVSISGTVSDRHKNPIAAVTVTIENRDDPGARASAQSDDRGAFRCNLDRAGSYLLKVVHPDFFPIEGKPIDFVPGANIVNIELVRSKDSGTTLDVYAEEQLAAEVMALSQALEEAEIDSIPTTRSSKQRIQGVAAVLPGVLRDPTGDLHFHGSSGEETNWTLDGFSLSDPSSGRLEMGLGAETVRSMDLFAGRYSAEHGKGTGGAMVLATRMGEDQLTQRFTNFVPGIDYVRGLRIRDWRPRHNVSGPILSNRAWFFNGLDLLYEEKVIPELPAGQDRNASWSINNSFRVQAKLTSRQTLSSGFVADYLIAPKSGLSPLDPTETTLDREARRYFFNLKDQFVLSPESVLDLGYAAYRSMYRADPRGSIPYRITSVGRAGNYPIASFRVSSRDELRANLYIAREGLGQHQLKAGANLGHTRFEQDIRRRPIEYFRVDGTQASVRSFGGTGEFEESNLEAGAYLQDRWAIGSRLVAELGLRWDRDRIVSRGAVTPRFSVAFTPPGLDGAKLSAGLGWIPATTYFRIFTRHRDQYPIFTTFARDGKTPLGPPDIRVFELDKTMLAIPTSRNLSASWQQRLPGGTALNVNYLRKRMGNGYAHVPVATVAVQDSQLPVGSRAIRLRLQNFRRDTYDSVEFSLSRPLAGSHRWFASYTYSNSWSNAALKVDTDNFIVLSDTEGRTSWDVPHRLVCWATFPLGKKTTIAYYAEWRDGFPFSAHNDRGRQVGQVNGWRLPRHFNLNIHIQRKVSFLGHRWSLRPGVDNLTNRPNYSVANTNVDSPEFLNLFGRSPIKLVVRVRWLGKNEN